MRMCVPCASATGGLSYPPGVFICLAVSCLSLQKEKKDKSAKKDKVSLGPGVSSAVLLVQPGRLDHTLQGLHSGGCIFACICHQ